MNEFGEHGALLVEHPDGAEASTTERAGRLDDETQQDGQLDLLPEMKSGVECSRERRWDLEIQR
jgi:hypothetical protein